MDILDLDKTISLFINQSNSPFFDNIMLFVSNSIFPIILTILIFLTYGYQKYKSKVFTFFFFLILTAGLADSISTYAFKKNFKRLRPCYQYTEQIRILDQSCGGKYGFISSHASNSFAIFTFVFLILKNNFFILGLPYAALVSYSRVYLGRHYMSDVLVGGLLGVFIALSVYYFLKKKTTLLKCL